MNLFDDTELFNPLPHNKKVFDLPDTDLMLIEGLFSKIESDRFYRALLTGTPWREAELNIYNKTMTIPRMISWYEDKSNKGADQNGNDWTPELLKIKARVEDVSNFHFNSVLLNLYRDGRDGVAWHSDREENFGRNAIIGSVTFGQTRPFRLRHKFRKDIPQVEIPLNHGSFLLMAGTTQTCWEHQIPKTTKDILPRINLTFRQVKR